MRTGSEVGGAARAEAGKQAARFRVAGRFRQHYVRGECASRADSTGAVALYNR